jgi:hypothetical protein
MSRKQYDKRDIGCIADGTFGHQTRSPRRPKATNI